MSKNTFSVISDEKRERIYEAAAYEFAQKGFDKANVNDIATKAGISKGSIYDYFENKEDLYLSVATHGISISRENIESIIDDKKDFFEQIRDIFLQGLDFVINNPQYVQLYVNVASCGMERFAEKLTLMVEKHTSDYYKAAIKKGIEEGIIRPDVDVNMTAFIINSLYVIIMISTVSTHYRIRLKEYLEIDDDQIDLVLREKIDLLVHIIRSSLKIKDQDS